MGPPCRLRSFQELATRKKVDVGLDVTGECGAGPPFLGLVWQRLENALASAWLMVAWAARTTGPEGLARNG